MADPFKFDLVSPERMLMSEEVDEVVVHGMEGQFTVLSGHAPVMTTLRPGVLSVTRSGKEERMFVLGGFADVNAEGLTVLAEQAMPLGDLNADELAKHIQAAEEEVADAKDDTEKANAGMSLNQLKDVQAERGR